MTRPSTPPILSELQSTSSPASQVAALRALKHEVIGHEQKKEMWIALGVLAPIARILNTHKGNGKRRHRDAQGNRWHSKHRADRSDEEEARLQAVIIVGSLAHGGSAYISPLHAGLVIPPLLSLLSPSESSPHLILEALKSLNNVADSLLLCHTDYHANHDGLLSLLYSEEHLATITHLLLQTSQSAKVQQQIVLVAALMHKTCREEHHRFLLTQAGVLEALAVRLASFVVATGCVHNLRTHFEHNRTQSGEVLTFGLPTILQAVSAIIEQSRSRAVQFLSTHAFVSIFQRSNVATTIHEKKDGLLGSNTSNTILSCHIPSTVIENLLPSLPMSNLRNPAVAIPNVSPLGTPGFPGRPARIPCDFSSADEVIRAEGPDFMEEEENPLIGWLFHLVRIGNEAIILAAARLLAILYRESLMKPGREAAFRLLLVPVLSRMLDKDLRIFLGSCRTYASGILTPEKFVKEKAPSVLAMIAANSPEVQKAAAQAGIIKKLSHLLKESYDEIPSDSASIWTPESTIVQAYGRDDASRLGPDGLSPIAYYTTRLRKSVLEALAAVASKSDEYRRAIIENGIIPFIIRTLKPEESEQRPPGQGVAQKYHKSKSPGLLLGNPKDTILAACEATKSLSRSVGVLRTSLMDAGLSAPLFVLLRHQDVDLQIAATAVVCNLVLQFSPLQEAFIEAGVLKILCEHAHSSNTILRLNSMWALKHLVLSASNEIKMNCLGELGPGWLKQIVSNDVEVSSMLTTTTRGDRDEEVATPIRMNTPNAAGEQVDLLNAVEEESRESNQDMEDDVERDLEMADSIGPLSRAELAGKRFVTSLNNNNEKISKAERSGSTTMTRDRRPICQGISDELAIQKEGLNLLRNLICGTGASEMIDVVFRELGQERLFELLAAKLRPRVLNAFHREQRSSENGVRQIQPQNEIVLAICYIIVHIAAGNPRQRQLLVAQTDLMKLLIPLFNHTEGEIRLCCVWVCINLTWRDSNTDDINCKVRARELAKLGVLEKLEQMERNETTDVQERSKCAREQMTSLLRF